jgi:Tfp pilus assembly protein PilX
MPGADVQSIEVLQDFRGALRKFSTDIGEALHAAEAGLREAEDWITERVRAWEYEVRRLTDEVDEAERSLAACEAETDEDGHGRSCAAEEAALAQARRHLASAEEQLTVAQTWMNRIWSAAAEYAREAMRMNAVCESYIDKGEASLSRTISDLESYRAEHV